MWGFWTEFLFCDETCKTEDVFPIAVLSSTFWFLESSKDSLNFNVHLRYVFSFWRKQIFVMGVEMVTWHRNNKVSTQSVLIFHRDIEITLDLHWCRREENWTLERRFCCSFVIRGAAVQLRFPCYKTRMH